MMLTEQQINQLTNEQMGQLLERFLKDEKFRIRYCEFCDSKTFMLEAIKKSHMAFQWCSDRLKNDPEFVYEAVWRNGLILSYVSKELRNNKNFVSIAVKQNGLALQFASARLKADNEIVMIAVKRDGFALRWALNELQQDDELINEALLQIYSMRYTFKGSNISKINTEIRVLFTRQQLSKFFNDTTKMESLKYKTIENGVNKVLRYMKVYPENSEAIKTYRNSVFKFVRKRLNQIEQYRRFEESLIRC